MERVVKFSLLCPTPKMALLRGRNQENINRVRNSTNARVSTNETTLNYTIVTLSAIEILENRSPAISAALQILPYCLETRDPHYKVGLVIEGQDRARLGEDFFIQWTQQTLTTIIVSNRQQDTLIEILGGNHGIRNALSMFLTHFRNSFFAV